MEKETVLILLLLKPMTKTSQHNDIHWWVPCAKTINSLCFATILMKHENEKTEIVLLLKPMTKTKWKIPGRCFQTRTQSQIGFLGGSCVFSWTVSIY